MNGKHDHHHSKHEHGKHLGADLSTGGGTVSLTLDAGTAQDLHQALTLALSGLGSKGKYRPGGKGVGQPK